MEEEFITLSQREIKRLKILHRVMEREMTQVKASELLGVTDRQIRNIIGKIRQVGDKGIVHGSRGRRSPHRMTLEQEELIAKIIRKRYTGFGPTLASEKLLECEGIKVGKEKLRQVMIAKGLWQRRRKRKKIHQWRERKAYYGEMVQMDGSHHEWLEGRGPKLVFMGYVDDATNRVFGRFYDYEGAFPAMDSLERYIHLSGVPVSLYLDKHSTYKTTREPSLDELLRGESAQTQFERAAKELGIDIIHAHSPQAKGRIERVFGTLQDRLVKEMRLASITTQKEANEFLEKYLPVYNKRFSRPPLKEGNLHRRLSGGIRLRDIFCIKAQRTITMDYRVKWRGRQFLIERPSLAMKRRRVEVREHFDGEITIKFNGRYLPNREISNQKSIQLPKKKEPVVEHKKRRKKYIPPPDHPWRRHQPSLHYNCYLERI